MTKFEINADEVPKLTDELEQQLAKNRKWRRSGSHSPTSPKKARRKLQDQKLLNMRAEGKTIRECAEELDMPYPTAWERLSKAIERADLDNVDVLRQAANARLETALTVVMGVITGQDEILGLDEIMMMDGHEQEQALQRLAEKVKKDAELKLKAVDRLVNLDARMGKVNGYDAPTKLEGNGMGGDITVQFAPAMNKPAKMDEPEIIVEPQTKA